MKPIKSEILNANEITEKTPDSEIILRRGREVYENLTMEELKAKYEKAVKDRDAYVKSSQRVLDGLNKECDELLDDINSLNEKAQAQIQTNKSLGISEQQIEKI